MWVSMIQKRHLNDVSMYFNENLKIHAGLKIIVVNLVYMIRK